MITSERFLPYSQCLKLQRFIVWPMIFAGNLHSRQEKCMIEGKITRHPDIGRLSATGILYPTSCHFVVDCLSLQLVATKRNPPLR